MLIEDSARSSAGGGEGLAIHFSFRDLGTQETIPFQGIRSSTGVRCR
jgi:hypothetical protein